MSNKEQQDNNKIVTIDEITYLIKEDNTASVISIGMIREILIPRSIKYEGKEYIITSISESIMRLGLKVEYFRFASDSEVQIIEKNAFNSVIINDFSIPSKLTELKDGWCNQLVIEKITVSKDNPRYSMYEDKFLIGKSSIEQENYDVLVCCPRLIEGTIQIPDFIEIIGPNAFEGCKKIQQVEFSPDSKLRIIGDSSFMSTSIRKIKIPAKVTQINDKSFFLCKQLKEIEIPTNSELKIIGQNAFFETVIESISIPSKVTELKGGCFMQTKIDKITISQDNSKYSLYNDQLLVGKSSIESKNYDVLIYCLQSVKDEVKIPDFIEIIQSFAFGNNRNIKTVEFSPDSKLTVIEKGSFHDTSITSMSIPSKVKMIGEQSFIFCKRLKQFNIPENSELQVIEKNAFNSVTINDFSIPSKLTELKDGWCNQFVIEKITVSKDNPRYSMYEDKFLIGKSSIEQENYDVLVCCPRSIEGTIQIPDFIEIIGPNAFQNCKIQQVEFSPDSKLRIIGKESFRDAKLTSILIPPKVKTIDEKSFHRTRMLQKVDFYPNSTLEKICKSAFENSAIKYISLPSSLIEIEESAFNSTSNLQEVHFPEDSQLQIIGDCTFNSSNIQKISIPKHTKTIGEYCFKYSKLEQIDFHADSELVFIEKSAFEQSNIQSIKIPKTVKKIGRECFYFCDTLKNIEITKDSELQFIEQNAFQSSGIQKIFIPKHVKIIEFRVFHLCRNLKQVDFAPDSELEIIGKAAFDLTAIDEISIPSHVKIIEGIAFQCRQLKHIKISENSELQIVKAAAFYNSSIESFYIPSKLTVLEDGWMDSMSKLDSITVSKDNPRYSMYEDKFLIGKSSIEKENYDVLIYCPRSTKGTIQIPDFIEIICPNAFEGCSNIQQVEFSPDSKLRIIGDSSFMCTSIEKIKIPTKVTQINDHSFYSCQQLKEIEIPTNSELEIIGQNAFYDTAIESISIPSKVTELKISFLGGMSQLRNISISPRNQLYSTYDDGNFIIKKSSIEQQNYDILVFCCTKFHHITIPSFIRVLADSLFYFDLNIRQIHFNADSKLEVFGENAFENSSIEKITIPSSLKIIRKNCFANCRNLKKVIIPEDSQLEVIDNSLYGTKISSIFIPKHVKEINSDTFYMLRNLKIIEIDENCKIKTFNISMLDDNIILMISSKLRNQINFTNIGYEY